MALTGRLALHEELCTLLGSRNVYFRPTDHTKMKYPAITYERSNMDVRFADNNPYLTYDAYTVTIVDEDPDSEFVEKLAYFPMSRFSRHYTADGLNHDVFTIYHK